MPPFKIISTTLRWFFSIGRKYFRVTPFYTLVVVFATLVSQISSLLAFFLPLKIIILLASPGIPRYFPRSWAAYDREQLVIYLCLATVLFYLLHLVAEKLIKFYADKGAAFLLARTGKLILFADQDEKALKAYQRYALSVAALFFVPLALFFLGYFYFLLFGVITAYALLVFLFIAVGVGRFQPLTLSWEKNPGGIVNFAATMGFFLAFAAIVLDFLFGSPPGFILVIISMLLSRQLLQRIATFVTGLVALYADRLVINALFFQGHVLLADQSRHRKNYWQLLAPAQRKVWLPGVVASITGRKFQSVESRWFHSGLADVAAFELICKDENGQTTGRYLLKIFSPARKGLAMHEAAVFASCGGVEFPSLSLLGVEGVEKCICHLFPWGEEFSRITRNQWKKELPEILTKLLAYPIPGILEQQYLRTRQLIWQRLSPEIIERLKLAAVTPAEQEHVEQLAKALPEIVADLKVLPLQLINQDITLHTVIKDPEQGLMLTHWGRWCLEPLGSAWPIATKNFENLDAAFEQGCGHRDDCRHVAIEHVRLAALVYALERFYNKQDFDQALSLLPRLLKALAAVKMKPNHSEAKEPNE